MNEIKYLKILRSERLEQQGRVKNHYFAWQTFVEY